jgi:hypothetical protein
MIASENVKSQVVSILTGTWMLFQNRGTLMVFLFYATVLNLKINSRGFLSLDEQ